MRSLSAAMRAGMYAQETGLVVLMLLTLDHDDLASPERLVNNTENITSRGNTFTAFPFRFELPHEKEDEPPQVTVQIDNVDRRIVEALRGLSSAPSVTMEVVTSADDFESVEVGPIEYELTQIRYDALVVEGELTFEPVLQEGYPGAEDGRFSPASFPGLF